MNLETAVDLWIKTKAPAIDLFERLDQCCPRINQFNCWGYGRYGAAQISCMKHGALLLKPITGHTEDAIRAILLELLGEWNKHIGKPTTKPIPAAKTQTVIPKSPYRRKFT